MYKLKRLLARLVLTLGAVPELVALAQHPDHRLKSVRRKPPYRRFLDLVFITLRWGEVSTLYYVGGMDRSEARVSRDYLPYPVFRRMRNRRNRHPGTGHPFDYICLLQDKRLFDRYFASGGIPTVPVIGEIDTSFCLHIDGNPALHVTELDRASFDHPTLFCKPRFGIRGDDVFKIDLRDEGVFVNNELVDSDSLASGLAQSYICQDVIKQHETMAFLNPSSVNSLRVITFMEDDTPEPFLTFLRIGAAGNITDTDNSARAVARVDQGTGQLNEIGYWISGDHLEETTKHRSSDVEFADIVVPYFEECLELACRAHRWVDGVHSVGWDIAVTPTGPVLIEGNDDWSARQAMCVMPEFRREFLRRYAP